MNYKTPLYVEMQKRIEDSAMRIKHVLLVLLILATNTSQSFADKALYLDKYVRMNKIILFLNGGNQDNFRHIFVFTFLLFMSSLSLYGATEVSPNQTIITVKTAEELFQAIDSNRIIFLKPGRYILSQHSPTIEDIENLSIIGLGEHLVEILSASQKPVLRFRNVKHIVLDNIKVGHTSYVDTCTSAVVVFTDSSHISIFNSMLFGTGYEGLVLHNVWDLNFITSIIEKCVYGIMTIRDSSHILFSDATFRGNNGRNLINIDESSNIMFLNSTIHNNTCCSLFNVDPGSRVSLEKSTIRENGFPSNLYCADWWESQHDGSHAQLPVYPPFTIIRAPYEDDKNCDIIKISVSQGKPFSLGHVCKNESGHEDSGIYLESLQVYKLAGNPDLLHIKWTNIGAGASGSYGGEFLVCLSDHPETVLMSGSLPYYTAMGSGNWTQYSYRVEYEGNVLTFWAEAIKDSRRYQPEPLHNITQTNSLGEPFYMARIVTRLTRTYVVKDIKLFPLKTILEYQIQKGDTKEAICQGLNVETSWMQLSQDLPEAGGWIQILIPNNVIKEQARDLWKKWDWWWDFRT